MQRQAALYAIDAERTPVTEDRERAEEMVGKLVEWDKAAPPHREPNMSKETEDALRALGDLN